MKVGVLALQGAFIEHEILLKKMGAEVTELRCASDAKSSYDALVLPGGESTVQGKLLRELGMFDEIRNRIAGGMPVLGTCAGMILLAERLNDGSEPHLATMPITVKRNAYGRQLGSFRTIGTYAGREMPMTFIRAPYAESMGEGCQVLAVHDEKIVAVRFENQFALAFHPELDAEMSVYEDLLSASR